MNIYYKDINAGGAPRHREPARRFIALYVSTKIERDGRRWERRRISARERYIEVPTAPPLLPSV